MIFKITPRIHFDFFFKYKHTQTINSPPKELIKQKKII